MAELSLKEQIVSRLDRLSVEQQKAVLDFTQTLTRPEGVSGKVLLDRLKEIQIDPQDLEEMKQAIEEEFERIDLDGWDLPA
jgi:hypothetical protein